MNDSKIDLITAANFCKEDDIPIITIYTDIPFLPVEGGALSYTNLDCEGVEIISDKGKISFE